MSMALPQGQADGCLPAGDPSPSEGTPGPSQAPASPAATRRRALLRELEAQVQAAYGQVKGTGLWGMSPTEGTPREQQDPTPHQTDPGQNSGRRPRTCLLTEGSVSLPAAQEAGVSPHLGPHRALHPVCGPQGWPLSTLPLSTRARAGARRVGCWPGAPR